MVVTPLVMAVASPVCAACSAVEHRQFVDQFLGGHAGHSYAKRVGAFSLLAQKVFE